MSGDCSRLCKDEFFCYNRIALFTLGSAREVKLPEMRLRRLKWLIAILVTTVLLVLEYIRHVAFVVLLHSWPVYLFSIAVIVVSILIFNQAVFSFLAKMQNIILRQNQQLSALNAIAAAMSRSLDLDKTLNDALDNVLEVMELDAAGIHLVEGDRLPLKVYRNLPPCFVKEVNGLRVGEGLSGRVAKSGEPIVVREGFSQDPRLSSEIVRRQGFESFACVPLLSKGKVVGVLPMGAYRRQAFSAEDLELLAAIGSQIGVAVENAELHAQVQQRNSYLDALIESSANAIITTDLEGKILSWNQGSEEIYGWSKEEAIGHKLPMVPQHLMEEAYRWMTQVIRSGEPIYNIEVQRLRKDEELIPVMVTVSPIRDAGGRVIALLGISTDMSDRKRLEGELLRQQRALAVLKERERLARELHDSLGQILGYVNTQTLATRELLSKGRTAAADSHLKRLAEVAQDAHADVREYILSLQTSASMEQGLLPALEEYLKRFSRSNGIQAEAIGSDELAHIKLGPDVETQLMRIVQEALTNVRKHARAQHVRVSFKVNINQVEIAINDDGCGFDPARISQQDGLHFGLRIMQERVAEIGGSTQVHSMPGQGTSVKVKVPLHNQGGD